MSEADYNKIRKTPLLELPFLDAYAVVEWLSGQHQAVGEAVAKACYQLLAEGK